MHELGRQRRRDKEPDKRQRATIEAYARHAGFELIAHYVERGRKGVKRSRVALQDIERRLAMRDLEAAVDQDVLATMQQKAQRELKQ